MLALVRFHTSAVIGVGSGLFFVADPRLQRQVFRLDRMPEACSSQLRLHAPLEVFSMFCDIAHTVLTTGHVKSGGLSLKKS
eukprot:1634919-Amphidinium_carterae.1